MGVEPTAARNATRQRCWRPGSPPGLNHPRAEKIIIGDEVCVKLGFETEPLVVSRSLCKQHLNTLVLDFWQNEFKNKRNCIKTRSMADKRNTIKLERFRFQVYQNFNKRTDT